MFTDSFNMEEYPLCTIMCSVGTYVWCYLMFCTEHSRAVLAELTAHNAGPSQALGPTISPTVLVSGSVLRDLSCPVQSPHSLSQRMSARRTGGKWLDNHEAHTDLSRGILHLLHQEHPPRLHWSGHCPQIFPAAGTDIVRPVFLIIVRKYKHSVSQLGRSHLVSTTKILSPPRGYKNSSNILTYF